MAAVFLFYDPIYNFVALLSHMLSNRREISYIFIFYSGIHNIRAYIPHLFSNISKSLDYLGMVHEA